MIANDDSCCSFCDPEVRGARVWHHCMHVSQVNARPSMPLFSALETSYPHGPSSCFLGGWGLTEGLKGSRPCLRMRESQTTAQGSRKERKYIAFRPYVADGETKAQRG